MLKTLAPVSRHKQRRQRKDRGRNLLIHMHHAAPSPVARARGKAWRPTAEGRDACDEGPRGGDTNEQRGKGEGEAGGPPTGRDGREPRASTPLAAR